MRIDWDTPVDVLMHGENICYIDLDEDEIVHFKYIKREKLPGGGYRYYYDEEAADKGATKLQAQKQEVIKSQNAAFKQSQQYYRDVQTYKKITPDKELVEWGTSTSRKYTEQLYKKAEKAYKKYRMMKIIHNSKKSVAKGIVAVANAFTKLFNKKK